MTFLYDRVVTEWSRLRSEFETLQGESPFWFESSREYQKVFLAMAATAAYCTTIWTISLHVYGNYFATKETPYALKAKSCYQMTNMCFNFAIGVLGAYYHYSVLPTLPAYNATSSIERISGLFDEFYLMPAMQLGYQCWSIPIGTFYVNEKREMILHHLGVVLAASCGAFSNFGFRYWLPFFFGVFELSSVPLAIMNTFKDHPEAGKKHPILNLASRVSFVASFLYIRVWKWLPVGPLYMRNNFFLFLTTGFGATKLFVLLQFLFGVYLGYLQLYWAVMVIRLSLAFVFGKKKKE
uniref:TLC domain-containing protein n=1 Tax=Pseudo-nitzschia delicatissima TaxID=44447 RepID=A0A7S0T920_9STRA|mmetsp:Transcript_1355/g.3134  ORF Transcript_1355/g.3134 Transcript_1355/m.3134 type:complete len:295 (+) Transcript_1355:180-1064(+)